MVRPLTRPIASTPRVGAALLHLGLAASPASASVALFGKRTGVRFSLALGDSLASGYHPDLNFTRGYADDVARALPSPATGSPVLANLRCSRGNSAALLQAGCPLPLPRRFPSVGAQLGAALTFLHRHAGEVGLATLDIGANDLLPDASRQTCAIGSRFSTNLASLEAGLVDTILPQLHAALLVGGHPSADLLDYYDPLQSRCPASTPMSQMVNRHPARDIQGYGRLVDVFATFGGSAVPHPNLCAATWMCSSPFPNAHPTSPGYRISAGAILDALSRVGGGGNASGCNRLTDTYRLCSDERREHP